MKRRSFLKAAGTVAGGCALGMESALTAGSEVNADWVEKVSGLPRRVLGRTGRKISMVGFPGLCLIHYDQNKCTDGIHSAFDRGVNYFDVAPAYGNGESEVKMGIGLQGLDRSKIFLACKTKMRDKARAREELDRSLQRLKTDHFDLYQLHHIQTPEQVAQALGPGGAMETILEAKKAGKIRHIGFSAHTRKGALAALDGFDFDTAMFPINFVEDFRIGFGAPVLKRAAEKGAAVLAIKPLSMGAWAEGAERKRKWWYRTTETDEEVSLAMRYTLSQKPVIAGIPPSFLDLLDKAVKACNGYRRISEEEVAKLAEVAKGCESVFQKEEERVACGGLVHEPVYADSPHECCCGYA
ncbi:MAG: aldo/keto reductase [Sedimentisphaerales bacterium]|nr:aldo/keto reductase [Sedimentisphaerales bacterium]